MTPGTAPTARPDTSDGNHYVGNLMGFDPAGDAAPNGTDFWWDQQGSGNCWEANASSWGLPRSDPSALPSCGSPSSGGRYAATGTPAAAATVAACSAYSLTATSDPSGCPWLTPPAPVKAS
jgi:hypothetical protein